MTELRLKRRDLRRLMGETDYGLDQLMLAGVLERPLRDRARSHPYWTVSMLERAQEELRKLADKNRPNNVIAFTPRQKERIQVTNPFRPAA